MQADQRHLALDGKSVHLMYVVEAFSVPKVVDEVCWPAESLKMGTVLDIDF